MAQFTNDIFFRTIAELNAGLRLREYSAVELARAYCERFERLGPRYNALALVLQEEAVRQAKQVDDEIKRERFRGSLQGIPYGVKDLIAVAKHPTTWGAKPYQTQVFDEDAQVVRKLARTGGVLIGKLSMVELAGGGGYRYPAASLQGPGLNPWDRTRWSGGSSSGSGSAVAAGLVGFALGSETSGSILTPSAFCGVTGLRPTYGLVSRRGAMALSWTMDKIGPMCRSAEDCGLVLQAISGGDAEDPGSAGKSFYFAPQYVRPFTDLRVGYSPVDFDELPEAAAKGAFKEALAAMRSLGMQFREISLPDMPYGAVTSTIISSEGSAVFEELIASGKVDELADQRQIQGLKAGLEIPAKDYLRAMRIRSLIQQEFRKLFVDVDMILAPARYGIASKIDQPLDRGLRQPRTGAGGGPAAGAAAGAPGAGGPRGMSVLIGAGNLAGLPAISLPCGFVEKMPVALQLVTRPFGENMILRTGMEFQKQTSWHKERPPVS